MPSSRSLGMLTLIPFYVDPPLRDIIYIIQFLYLTRIIDQTRLLIMNLFQSQSFQLIGVTVISSAIGVFVKYASRNDNHGAFKKDDLAIGLELCITALIMLITSSVSKYNKLNSVGVDPVFATTIKEHLQTTPWIILLTTILLWGLSTIVRKKGWNNPTELNSIWGILIPNLIGMVLLLTVFMWIKE